MRAQRYWYRDGLAEIPLGVLQLLLSGSNLIEALGDRASSWYVPVNLTYTVLLFGLAMFASRIMAAVRERITYPRSGYVGRERRTLAVMVVALLVGVTCLLALRYAARTGLHPARLIRWTPAVLGLMTGVGGVYVAVRYGLPRFLVVGVLAIILGVVVSIGYPYRLAMAIWLAVVGCAWLCSGGVTLWNYLRTVPPSAYEP
jgi:hypothetical protein